MSSAEPLLQVTDLTVSYDDDGDDGGVGGSAGPDGVSFDLRPGEVLLVLGPSGCGKSTLTLTLDGLVPHSLHATVGGTVRVGGVDTRETTVGRLAAEVGMVFQDPDAQVVTATVLDEVCFGLENLALPVTEIEPRAREALAQVGLADRADDDPDELSGGGRQRLALACALAMRPRVLVLDEPTANLDPVAAHDLYRHLGRLVDEHDLAVVLVEHTLDEAMALVDRILVLDDGGRQVACGPAADVLAAHAARLDALGVWIPTGLLVARRLATLGIDLEPAPLTCEEAAERLAAAPELPPVAVPSRGAATAGEHAGTAVRIEGLRVRRGGRTVLHDVSTTVPAGDLLAIVGANGAGKSTLARALAGVEPPPVGTVTTAGLDVGAADAAEIAARIGFVFQNPEHQFVTGTVADEVALGLRLLGRPDDEVAARVDEALARFRLGRHAGRNPFLLSHGQKRRLSVAAALVVAPEVLVLDEPTFGQDRANAEEILALLAELPGRGTTVVVVTHDLQAVAEHARHVAVVADGAVVAHDDVERVLADDDLLAACGLRPPPIRRIVAAASRRVPSWGGVLRVADLVPCPVAAPR